MTTPLPVPVSFEFFPPKTPESEENLWRAITRLAPLAPKFVSVTYGAGGSTRERTHRTVKRLLTEANLIPAAHLTCVGATKDELNDVADAYASGGAAAFAAALYGQSWDVGELSSDEDALGRDLAMFRAFEPSAPLAGGGPVVVSVGELSPPIRHRAAEALQRSFGLDVRVLPHSRHAVHLDNPIELAAAIHKVAR